MGYLRNALCLIHQSPDVFGRSQWPLSQVTYIYYRYLFAFYVIGWDILITLRGSYKYGGWYQADIKVWTFHLLALYSFISVVSALVHWVRTARWRYDSFVYKEARAADGDAVLSTSRSTLGVGPEFSIYRSIPWYYRLDWLLFNICLSMNPIVTILYQISIINQRPAEGVDTLSNIIIIHLTLVNTCLILIDLAIRRIPVMILHAIYPMGLWVIYVTVNVILQSTTETSLDQSDQFLYAGIFDWNTESTAVSIGYALAFFFGIFVIHVIAFALFKLRKALSRRCVKGVGSLDDTDYPSEANFKVSSGLCCSACGRGRASHNVVFS